MPSSKLSNAKVSSVSKRNFRLWAMRLNPRSSPLTSFRSSSRLLSHTAASESKRISYPPRIAAWPGNQPAFDASQLNDSPAVQRGFPRRGGYFPRQPSTRNGKVQCGRVVLCGRGFAAMGGSFVPWVGWTAGRLASSVNRTS